MKNNQMFIAGTRQFTISAEKSNNHQAFTGYQLVCIYSDQYGNLKADNLTVKPEVFNQFSGSAIYDVEIGFGSKPVILSIKKVTAIAL